MENKNRFNTKGLVIKAVLAVVTIETISCVAGCGKQIDTTVEHTVHLHTMTWLNTQQITCNMESIEDNQDILHVTIEDIQSSNEKKAADIVAVIEIVTLHSRLNGRHKKPAVGRRRRDVLKQSFYRIKKGQGTIKMVHHPATLLQNASYQ